MKVEIIFTKIHGGLIISAMAVYMHVYNTVFDIITAHALISTHPSPWEVKKNIALKKIQKKKIQV